MIRQLEQFAEKYGVHTFFLQDGQSWPIVLETDYHSSTTTRSQLEGRVVLSNEECG